MLAAFIEMSTSTIGSPGYMLTDPVTSGKRPLTDEIIRCFTANPTCVWLGSRVQVWIPCSRVVLTALLIWLISFDAFAYCPVMDTTAMYFCQFTNAVLL